MNAGPASAKALSRFTWGVSTSSYPPKARSRRTAVAPSVWDNYCRACPGIS